MKSILTTLLLIIAFHCNTQNNSEIYQGDYGPKEFKALEKYTKQFQKFNYSKVVKKFGEPTETRKIEISADMLLSILSDEQIAEHFPKSIEHYKDDHIIEATWKLLSASWITVWYKLENGKWKPINTLMAI